MSRVEFIKYHGLGNDFILIDVDEAAATDRAWGARARAWCDRHMGIGADGVLLIAPSPDGTADVTMRIVNADGSNGGVCGNGLRCVARHMAERKGWKGEHIRIAIGERVMNVAVRRDGTAFGAATVDMGTPDLMPERIPLNLPRDRAVRLPWRELLHAAPGAELEAAGVGPTMTCVSMGNPHAVFFCRSISERLAERFGAAIETDALFPQRTNVQFAEVVSRTRLAVATWERGVGVTMACGTGACAAVVAAVLEERTEREVTVGLRGGDLTIKWDAPSNHVLMTGPAAEVFTGQVEISA